MLKQKKKDEEEDEFDDDFDDEEDDKEESVRKPAPKKQIEEDKDEEDDFDEDNDKDDEEEEEEVEKKVETRGRKPKTFEPKVKPQNKNDNEEEPIRFSPYHVTERTGIKDNVMNNSIGEDVFTLLSKVLNDLESIKKAVGA